MPTRYAAPFGALLLALLLSSPASAATCTWVGGTTTWQTPSAWSCNAVPGPTDDVVVASGTVTFAVPVMGPGAVTVRSFTMTGGMLDGDGTVTVSESLVWEAGTMAGEGATIVLGAAELKGATSKNVRRTVYLRGVTTWSNGTLVFGNGGVLVNEGTFADTSVGTHSIARTGDFTAPTYVLNRGTWSVTSSGTAMNVDFINEGSFTVGGGGLRVSAPGHFVNQESGTFAGTHLVDFASGAIVMLRGRTQPFGAGTVGVFPVEGPLPMTETHVLDVDLAGPEHFDQLASARGSVSIAGRLLVRVGSEAVVGGTYPILTHSTNYPMTGCYEPDDIGVTEPDGVTPAPYVVEATCSPSGVQLTVTRPSTAGEGDPSAARAALTLTGANPFSGRTTLALTAPTTSHFTVEAFDALGRRVAVLYEGVAPAGQAVPIAFEAGALPAGLYYVRAAGAGLLRAQRLTLVR